ncbi:Putative phosducin, thioredoxin-like domain, Thioredoxin-like superfamily [Septoria linicola]|uniref:Phosducin, thioredoxin-like domain, Thioredoxin-like superfamily n=1 Tax=Septoria linicola TaxID=215465 RepID=A0A9Q9EHG1_9PEZI|nr:putative phosducin, thioredoxin-like domain, Thioredoxin-like superfamily [Septoria linicola]USW50955.1 Putative phosducin, thioredoxin-like domain, Thioredoxin-like superfamily [Septoria linicola]
MNNMPDMPVNVPVDDPDADTEWNDILRSKGIIPEKEPSPTPQIEAALLQARELAHENRLEGKDLDELDELEDDEDEAFLDQYRQKRMAEMAELQQTSVFNQVYPVQKPEWSKEVTDASKEAWVFVLLTSSSGTNIESQLMIELWRGLASKFGDIKFCQIQGNLCIEGYPDKNTPTVLVYKDTEIKRQIVTLRELNGDKTSEADMEKLLTGLGAVKYGDSRLRKREEEEEDRPYRSIRQSDKKIADDDDSDWD